MLLPLSPPLCIPQHNPTAVQPCTIAPSIRPPIPMGEGHCSFLDLSGLCTCASQSVPTQSVERCFHFSCFENNIFRNTAYRRENWAFRLSKYFMHLSLVNLFLFSFSGAKLTKKEKYKYISFIKTSWYKQSEPPPCEENTVALLYFSATLHCLRQGNLQTNILH